MLPVNEQFTVYTANLYETNHTLFLKERKIWRQDWEGVERVKEIIVYNTQCSETQIQSEGLI